MIAGGSKNWMKNESHQKLWSSERKLQKKFLSHLKTQLETKLEFYAQKFLSIDFNWFLTMNKPTGVFCSIARLFCSHYKQERKLNSSSHKAKHASVNLFLFYSTFCPFFYVYAFCGHLKRRRRWKQKEKLRIIKLTASV